MGIEGIWLREKQEQKGENREQVDDVLPDNMIQAT